MFYGTLYEVPGTNKRISCCLDLHESFLQNLYDEAYDYFSKQHPDWEEERICHVAEKSAKRQFEELPEPGDYDD